MRLTGIRERLPKVFSEAGRGVFAVYFELDQGIPTLADTSMTLAHTQRLTHWSAEYVSFRADPPQPVLGSVTAGNRM